MEQYVYAPINASKDIRLLCLNPTWKGEALEGEIIRCVLETAEPFCALSYVWGSHNKPFKLSTPGGYVPLTQSLYDALHRIRDPDHHLRVWIDAICIDQEDTAEKGIQISTMKDIYAKASETIVDLGESSAPIQLALEAVQMIFKDHQPDIVGPECEINRQRNIPSGDIPQSLLWYQHSEKLVLTPLLEAGIKDLSLKSYFGRRWIVQEVVASVNHPVYVHCGSQCIEWIHLVYGLAIIMNDYEPHSVYEIRDKYDEMAPDPRSRRREFMEHYRIFNSIERIQNDYVRGGGAHIGMLLKNLQKMKCERRHDLILSLIGISTIRETIHLDWTTVYKGDVDTLCLAVAKSLVEMGELELLFQSCKHSSSMPSRLSWIPNINDDFVPFTVFYERYSDRNRNLSDFHNHWKVCENDASFLQVNVQVIDSVTTVLHTPKESVENAHLDGTIVQFVEATFSLFQDAITPFSPTSLSDEGLGLLCSIVLLAGWCWNNVWDPTADEATNEMWLGFTSYYLVLREIYLRGKGNDVPELSSTKSDIDSQTLDAALEYMTNLSQINNMGFGAICLTKRCFASNLPYPTSEGDLIVMIPGVGVPVVLQESEAHPGSYRYLGPGYVVGLMKGEALSLNGVEERKIFIH